MKKQNNIETVKKFITAFAAYREKYIELAEELAEEGDGIGNYGGEPWFGTEDPNVSSRFTGDYHYQFGDIYNPLIFSVTFHEWIDETQYFCHDGNVRKDFPGGFPGDKHNCFTAEGRTKAEQDMFTFLSRLLHWRQGNDVISKGRMVQFIPYKGVYVVARTHNGRHAVTIINGTRRNATLEAKRYAELTEDCQQAQSALDIPTGERFDLTKDIALKPRQTLVLEY